MNNTQKPETLVLHYGYRSDPMTKAVSVPIFQTTAYEHGDVDETSNIFACLKDGNTYARVMNPTCMIFEDRMAEVEGGKAALSTSAGQSATSLAILNLCETGDNIVSSHYIYGNTWTLFAHTLRRMGIEVRMVDPRDPENFRKATDDKTMCYYGETLSNPVLFPFPIEDVANIGKEYGIPLIIDNTMMPICCRPFDFGAAVTVHSTTKYIGGHGTSMGGIIIDSGNFDWTAYPSRFPLLNRPDEAHGNTVWKDVLQYHTTSFGRSAYLLKTRMTWMRDLGSCQSPFNAFLMLQGLETLPLRMKAHCDNAEIVAKELSNHPKIAEVGHPSLMKGKDAKIAKKQFLRGLGAVVMIRVSGGLKAGVKFIEGLEMFYHVSNVGDTRSLATHPASTTHSKIPKLKREAAGIHDGTIRLCIGIEHIDDILADLMGALDNI